MITGLPENQALREGQTVLLTCSANDGSPKPKLTWFRVNGDGSEETQMISDITDTQSYSNSIITSSESSNINGEKSLPKEQSLATIKIISSREDNNRLYR